jgi:hypothetical protein
MCFSENQSILNPHQCENGICDECLFRYIRVVINGEFLRRNRHSMRMGCYCGVCDLTIAEEMIMRILGKDRKLLRKYERYKANLLVKYNENYCWCPRPGCETILMKSPIDGITNQKLLICSTCQFHFCSHCRNEYLSDHGYFPCHEVRHVLAPIIFPFSLTRLRK